MKAHQLFETNAKNTISNHETATDISEQTIFIKSGSEFHQLFIQNIKYIESDGNYVTFHTDKRPILARYKLSEVVELLPKEYFLRIHRSYIVAIKHIETVKKHCAIIDSKEIPISRNYRDEFIAMIDDKSKKRDN
jgi:DNA-binding LytR/AlgR family response regulator